MGVKLKDVAEKLQVSQGLVSGVLNNNPAVRVSPEKRARVIATARRLGYRPNAIARALTSGSSKVIAVWISNPFCSGYTELLTQLHKIAHEDGYQLMVSETVANFDYVEHETTQWTWPVDGIIAVDSTNRASRHVLSGDGTPLVCLGASLPVSPDFTAIDLAPAVEDAIHHLVEIGRTRIAFLTPDPVYFGDARVATYHSVLERIGLAPEVIVVSAWNDRSGACESVCRRLGAPDPPDALLCFSDDLAIGAYRGVRESGLTIPSDVSIIGCGNTEEGRYQMPPLSSIDVRYFEMCRAAWDMLLCRCDRPQHSNQAIKLPAKYVPRESST